MNIHNNYSSSNCTKNFMIFCAIFLLTRKIICAILESQKETNGRPKRQKGKKENDHYRNERVSFRRTERRKEQNAHEQRKSLFLHIHAL